MPDRISYRTEYLNRASERTLLAYNALKQGDLESARKLVQLASRSLQTLRSIEKNTK